VNQFIYKDLAFNKGIAQSAFAYTPGADMHVSRMPGSCNDPVPGVK
jgi:hypothetical protein